MLLMGQRNWPLSSGSFLRMIETPLLKLCRKKEKRWVFKMPE
jgi:hypothetical protein